MRTIFSSEQIAQMKKNPCVFECREKSIHYTYEFKKRALDLCAQGVKPDEIWRQAGFYTSIWKKGYCRYTIKDWRRMVKKRGLESLTRLSGVQTDSGYKRARSPEADRVRRLELQVRYLEKENDFLVKLRPCEKYKLIRELKDDVSILCELASVSRAGYYKWLRNADEPDKDYKKIQRIMRKYGLAAIVRKKNPYKQMMKKSLEHRIFPNKLQRKFHQVLPFKVFCTDITYVPFLNRFAYLSVIKDIASGEVVAWNLSLSLEVALVTETVKNIRLDSYENIMIHSDQGFHYTNPAYIKIVKELKMIQSMSGKGKCIDNAPIESFFGHMKDELDYQSCRSFEQLRLAIDEYTRYYNHERKQWIRNKMTPVAYRDHLLTKIEG